MRVFDRLVRRLSPAAASALALALGHSLAPCGAVAAQLRQAAVVPAEASLLKRLPASRDELVFRGENASRDWLVYLSPAEAARAASFQLAMLNAVVVLPDRSSLKLSINGHPLSTLPIRSPDGITVVRVKIPAGVLTPGFNKVHMSVALTHRVDCSVKATYELWALLDPAKTGIALEGGLPYSVRSLDELAAEPLAEDGTTRIHLRMADNADPESIGLAGRFINVLVRRAGLVRPIVDVGPDFGQGSGFDVVLADGSSADEPLGGLRLLGRENNVTLARDPTSDRLVVVLSGATLTELDERISELDRIAPRQTVAQSLAEGVAIDAGARKSFAELGFETDNFAGRHYMSTVDLKLPADFFPASHDRVRLLIDGGASGLLDQNSELIFSVNGTIVSSMPLVPGKPEQFARKLVELPLRSFRPGHNELAIEAITSSPLDRQCDVVAAHRDTRLTIAGTSELEFPQFAHLGAIPQLPSALAGGAGREQGGRLNLYLPDLERASIGTALTVLANMTSAVGRTETPLVHLEPPGPGEAPGVVIAPIDQLPEKLAAPLRRLIAPPAAPGDAANVVGQADAGAGADARQGADQTAASGETPFNVVSIPPLAEAGLAMLRSHGFFFSIGDRDAGALPFSANSLLIGAVSPTAAPQSIGGVEIPQIVRDASQWLVITAQTSDGYASGVERLVANGHWSALAGEAVSLDLETNQLRSVQPSRVAYVAPGGLALSEIRPILGGVVSDNILLSLGALILLMSILGVSTHVVIRRMGAR
ncbi:MAG: cellulose biosynthesis cyclic di-GMP-binding regulatory protein BcsB [Roseiarcus sp.]